MIRCMFAGHRTVFDYHVREKVAHAVDELLKSSETQFVFYDGNRGEFDAMCASVVRSAKRCFSQKEIRLCLVEPYMRNVLNCDKDYYEAHYDEVLIPSSLAGVYYKKALALRNEWLVDHSDVLIAYVIHGGGAQKTLQYAEKCGLLIQNVAKSI